jgi:protein SCO1/2
MNRAQWMTILAVTALAVGYAFPAFQQAAAHHSTQNLGSKENVRRVVRIPVPDSSLTDHNGNAFRFGGLMGKVVLVTFIYTTCPDLCPLITTAMQSVRKDLDTWERDGLFFLSITTDPEVDTPPVLKSYGERHGVDFSRWSFLTEDSTKVAPVWKAFGVKVDRKARGLVDHTLLTALVDKKGVVRFVYHGAVPDPGTITRDLRSLLSAR